MNDIIPTVGMGVTQFSGSDRHPYTIADVVSERKIMVRADSMITLKDSDLYGEQKYLYDYDKTSPEIAITKRKNGEWITMGDSMGTTGGRWHVGSREEYRDPHF